MFLLGPLTAVAAAAALQQVPERIVEVHVQLDLRAAVLLVACLAAVGAAWAALAAPPAEEKAAPASNNNTIKANKHIPTNKEMHDKHKNT